MSLVVACDSHFGEDMIVRWIGAYRNWKNSLSEAIDHELCVPIHRVRCAERLCRGRSNIRAKVGLLVKNSAIIKRFRGDVWSEPIGNGKLKATRKQTFYPWHTECWVKPVYIGIVIKRHVKTQVWQTCVDACIRHNMPLFKLTKNGVLNAVNLEKIVLHHAGHDDTTKMRNMPHVKNSMSVSPSTPIGENEQTVGIVHGTSKVSMDTVSQTSDGFANMTI